MDRRRFLASAAATAIAPSCLAQPATFFANNLFNGPTVLGDGLALTSISHPPLPAHMALLADAMRRTKEMVGASAFMQGPRP